MRAIERMKKSAVIVHIMIDAGRKISPEMNKLII